MDTDKDGIIMCLLAAEILARTGKDPGTLYDEIATEYGASYYTRIDAPATLEQKAELARLSPVDVRATALAGDPILAKYTRAPGNGAPLGGLKVTTKHGWFCRASVGDGSDLQNLRGEFYRRDPLAGNRRRARGIVGAVTSAGTPA